jgi:hypothetical protein
MQSMNLPAATPVICPSPFVEAKPPAWQENSQDVSFLYAHLSYYPVPGKLYLFPYALSSEAENYATRLTRETLVHFDRFVIYGGFCIVTNWCNWFARQPELAGWRWRSGNFGFVLVVVFEKASAAKPEAGRGGG